MRKHVSDEQFPFEQQARRRRLPLLKAARTVLTGLQNLSEHSKGFGTQRLRTSYFKIILKGQLNIFGISAEPSPNPRPIELCQF
jgi:hypothetical protein